jgi:hypothetical protein
LPTRTASCPDAFSDLATLEVSFAARGVSTLPPDMVTLSGANTALHLHLQTPART